MSSEQERTKEQSVTITPTDFEPVAVQWNVIYRESTGEVVDFWMSELDEPK